jgi:TctA family transporter
MITLSTVGSISPIFLTVLLIIYLILVELGDEKMKKTLLPLVLVLIVVFLIGAVISIISQL